MWYYKVQSLKKDSFIMYWREIFYGVGVIVSIVVIYHFIKEFKKIAREKDDYDGKVDLPD